MMRYTNKQSGHLYFVLFLTILVLTTLPRSGHSLEKLDLSLNSIILFALHENPDIGMARERTVQAEHFVKEGLADYYPSVQLTASGAREYNNPASGADGSNINNSSSVSVAVQQILFDGFETVEEVRRRRNLIKASEFQERSVVQEVLNDSINFYLSIYRYQKTLENMDVFLVKVDEIVETINQMYEAGAASKAMLDYAKSRQSFARTEASDTAASLNDAISNLEFLTGKLPPFRAIPPERLDPDNLNIETYIDFALENNTSIKVNSADKAAMENSLNIEKASYYPSLSFRLETGQTNNDGGEVGPDRDVKALFEVSYEIFDGFSRKAANERVKSQVKEIDIQKQKIIKELKRQIKLYYNQLDSIRAAIDSTQDEIISNEALQELNRENFKLGTINLIELIEGEERLNSARIREHRLTYELYLTTYQLLLEVGSLEEQYFCNSC